MKTRKMLTTAGLLFAICVVALIIWPEKSDPKHSGGRQAGINVTEADRSQSADHHETRRRTMHRSTDAAALNKMLADARHALHLTHSPTDHLGIINALLSDLGKNTDKRAIAAAIIRFLDSEVDAPTGLMFTVGANGHLKTAPSLRTALLDELGRLDRGEAFRYAETIYRGSNVPDEWALALRDQALFLGRTDGRVSSLPNRVRELLENPEWNEKPTAGFLHAFDVAVFLGGQDMVASLLGVWRERSGKPAEFAARLALDRIAQRDFLAVAEPLASTRTAYLDDRADILARADVRVPEQRLMIESYISTASIDVEEKRRFIESLPNGNLQLSANLVTRNLTVSMDSLYQRDKSTLEMLQAWRDRAAMSGLHPTIDARIAWLRNLAQSRKQ